MRMSTHTCACSHALVHCKRRQCRNVLPASSLYPPVLTPLSGSPPRKQEQIVRHPPDPPNLPLPTHPISHTLRLDTHPLSGQRQNRTREWKGCAKGRNGNGRRRMELMFAGENQRGMKRNDQKKKEEEPS